MPELPEVETVRRGLEPVLLGHRIVAVDQRRPDLRIPFPVGFAGLVEGCRVEQLRRKAKYLLFDLDDGLVLICHLGMSGRMVVQNWGSNQPPEAHDHVVFTTDDGARIIYNDHRRFGLMTLTRREEEAEHPLLAAIAADPLDPLFGPEHLSAQLACKATPIKAALLDQKVVGGVGNIYACEALSRAGISPRRLAKSVAGKRCERLAPAIVDVLNEAIAAGGSSLRDHRQASGELGYFQHNFRVYDREGVPCPTPGCPGTVRRIVQSNRSTFFCGRCQR
ncbi:MAG: bifunctional DNA-formamidopyrimidine glycosylase/DNA-(apurinic or apyrimidinic site) lyase [Rhodospirillales bacterium]|nr:bifunctional DNA-formamidopyrimidine glycosylase/DNA-(apurinic or apyrimidinic site) lyase [Rhodospirillales bacterium]